MQIVGKLAYISEGTFGLEIASVSNRMNIVSLGRYDTASYAWDVQVIGNLAYVADQDDGFLILDISNPTNITRLGGYDTPGYPRDIDVVGNLAYVADTYTLRIFDVSNPAAVVEKGSIDVPSTAFGVFVTNNLAFVTGFTDVVAYDVTDPAQIVALGTNKSVTGFSDVEFFGGQIYAAERELGLSVLSPVQVLPAIQIQPTNVITLQGTPVTFTGFGTGTAPLSYQWRRNGTPLPGATASRYTISKTTTNDSASYDFIISNVKGAVLSSAANLSITETCAITRGLWGGRGGQLALDQRRRRVLGGDDQHQPRWHRLRQQWTNRP
jgi:hypothetical protein